jgi:hypothetical protein
MTRAGRILEAAFWVVCWMLALAGLTILLTGIVLAVVFAR